MSFLSVNFSFISSKQPTGSPSPLAAKLKINMRCCSYRCYILLDLSLLIPPDSPLAFNCWPQSKLTFPHFSRRWGWGNLHFRFLSLAPHILQAFLCRFCLLFWPKGEKGGGKPKRENFIVALCWPVCVCVLSELPESVLRKIASKWKSQHTVRKCC